MIAPPLLLTLLVILATARAGERPVLLKVR